MSDFKIGITVRLRRNLQLIGLAQLHIAMEDNNGASAALARAEQELPDLPYIERARHHAVIGQVYLSLENAQKARVHLDGAEQIADQLGSTPLRARVLISKAMASSQENDLASAEELFEHANREIAKIDDERVRETLQYSWLSELADHEMSTGSYEDAYVTLTALQAHIGSANPDLTIQIAHEQGKALFGMKRCNEAERVFGFVADEYVSMFGPNHSATESARRDLEQARIQEDCASAPTTGE